MRLRIIQTHMILVFSVCFPFTQPLCFAESTNGKSSIIDVGINGVCMYGHWLSGEVEIRLEKDHIILGGFIAYPTVPKQGVEGLTTDLPDYFIEKAEKKFGLLCKIMRSGRLLIKTSGVRRHVGTTTRNSESFWDIIETAKNSTHELTNENWPFTEIYSSEAEQIRSPIPLSRCGGY